MKNKCEHKNCENDARVAFRITRPTRADMRLTIFPDDRVAPKTATKECRKHGFDSINSILKVLIDND